MNFSVCMSRFNSTHGSIQEHHVIVLTVSVSMLRSVSHMALHDV